MNIIIDGYNLIGIYHNNMDKERKRLVNLLSKYKKIKGYPITVVFDGYGGISAKDITKFEGGIRIIFSGIGKKADDVIKEIILKEQKYFVVVSSDKEIAKFVWSKGCVPVRSEDFIKKLKIVFTKESDFDNNTFFKTKKGSSFKLSKKQKAIVRALSKL